MMGFGHVAKLVRDHVVDGVKGGFDQAAVQHHTRAWRHRAPALLQLANDQALGAAQLAIVESLKVRLDAFGKLGLCLLRIPCFDKFAGTGPDRSGANTRRHGLPGTGRA